MEDSTMMYVVREDAIALADGSIVRSGEIVEQERFGSSLVRLILNAAIVPIASEEAPASEAPAAIDVAEEAPASEAPAAIEPLFVPGDLLLVIAPQGIRGDGAESALIPTGTIGTVSLCEMIDEATMRLRARFEFRAGDFVQSTELTIEAALPVFAELFVPSTPEEAEALGEAGQEAQASVPETPPAPKTSEEANTPQTGREAAKVSRKPRRKGK